MRLLERGLPVRKPPLCHELGGQDARAPLEERGFSSHFHTGSFVKSYGSDLHEPDLLTEAAKYHTR
jgi:hypothetical protein